MAKLSLNTPIDKDRLVPQIEGVKAEPTKRSITKNPGYRPRSKKPKENNEVFRAIAERKAFEKQFRKSLLEENDRVRRYASVLKQHDWHTEPHPECGECQLELEHRAAKDRYYAEVWRVTESSYVIDFATINPEGVKRGVDWHLDHRFSIAEGFRLGVAPEIIGATANLTMLPAAENIWKSDRCSVDLDQISQP